MRPFFFSPCLHILLQLQSVPLERKISEKHKQLKLSWSFSFALKMHSKHTQAERKHTCKSSDAHAKQPRTPGSGLGLGGGGGVFLHPQDKSLGVECNEPVKGKRALQRGGLYLNADSRRPGSRFIAERIQNVIHLSLRLLHRPLHSSPVTFFFFSSPSTLADCFFFPSPSPPPPDSSCQLFRRGCAPRRGPSCLLSLKRRLFLSFSLFKICCHVTAQRLLWRRRTRHMLKVKHLELIFGEDR